MKSKEEICHQSFMDWLFPPDMMTNKEECDKANGEYVKRRVDYEAHKVGFEAGMKYSSELQQAGVINEK